MSPTASHLPGPYLDSTAHHRDEEYSSGYHPSPTTAGSSEPSYNYTGQPGFYTTSTPVPYPQPVPARAMSSAPYPYNYSAAPGASAAQIPEGAQPPQPYAGEYGGSAQPPAVSQRNEPYYYPQPAATETPYGRYMPFPQTHLGLQYPDSGQPSSPHPSTGSSSSQRPNSPDRQANDPRPRRTDEVQYGPIGNSYRHIISTVSQVSPSSSSTGSTGQTFEPEIVDGMIHQAVQGLRQLDPTRAGQYAHPYEYGVPAMASGAVAEAPAETVFVQYYEDGRADNNPTKKKKRERKGATQCASCQATSTPEWRRGPLGPRTLCNACGLVYAKLMKKRAKEDKLSPAESPRRPRPKGKARQVTEESEEEKGTELGSDDALPPPAGPSEANEPGHLS
ncbi:hypothetical protein BDV93DRAFT_604844 [Ceratobasidium sp. AG-I]|nr:hypothetical protein BDV93DRAFT_604844 [Ceratobasidium sp. AG-I]